MRHLSKAEFMSRREEWDGVTTRYDYRTAHHRAGDSGYQTLLPETCAECHRQEASAKEAGVTVTKPDEEWVSNGD